MSEAGPEERSGARQGDRRGRQDPPAPRARTGEALTTPQRGALAWAAVVVPTWIVLVLCTHWEPVAHDGWGHFLWQRNIGMSWKHLFEFAQGTYVHNNPRFGQVLTLILFTPGPYHSIVTPIVELGLFYLLTLLVLGRWPCWKRTDDALLFATILAIGVVTIPAFGMMLFYRPFTGNYLYGLVLNLLLLVPYRLHVERARDWAWWWTPLMLLLGTIAGLCNEHTGPGFAAALAAALFVFWRRGERFVPWAIAGLIGLIVGGILLYIAPGQAIRYNALAKHASLLGRIIDRGAWGNLRILVVGALYLLPTIVWIAIGAIARYRDRPAAQPANRRIAELALGALSLAITLTLLLSPKQGNRLYLATTVLAGAAIAGWVTAQLVSRWSRTIVAAVAAIVIVFAAWQCLPRYYTLHREQQHRLSILESAPMHSVAELPVYSIKRSRWSVGDDLLIENLRNIVSASFGLALIKMIGTTTSPPPEEP